MRFNMFCYTPYFMNMSNISEDAQREFCELYFKKSSHVKNIHI